MRLIPSNKAETRPCFISDTSLKTHFDRHSHEFQFEEKLTCESYLLSAQNVVADGILIQHMYHYYRYGSYRELRRSYIQPIYSNIDDLNKPFKLNQDNLDVYVVILCRRHENILSYHVKRSHCARSFLKTHHDVFSRLRTRHFPHLANSKKTRKRPILNDENLDYVKRNNIVIPYVFYNHGDMNNLDDYISSMKS